MTIQHKSGPKVVNLNRRRAIRERCLNCSAWHPIEVRDCEFIECSLFPFRSGQGKQNPKERSKAIRQYCMWCMNGQRSEVSKCPSTDCPLFPYRKVRIDRRHILKSIPEKGHIKVISELKN